VAIIIEGTGNLEDVKPYSLDIKDQQVFATKPTIESKFINKQLHSKFIQRFTILSNEDFLIPSVSFGYFDPLSSQTKILSTDELEITITDADNSWISTSNLIYLFVGFVAGVILVLICLFIQKKKPNKTLIQSIKKAKNDKELYGLLLPYSKELKDTKHISNLEENIYNSGKNRIKKRDIIADLSRLELG